ncbi:uncharacterized protein [Rutidosis leptorrhynchoides]|uniref:uncharacterized protein n=1 Tax=Rutidosis leptorrhynchoides TaxID=125765 RepID=UPI003A995684
MDIDDNERSKWLEARRIWLEKDKIKTNMMKQKSRCKWITEGEENTKYFHSLCKRRNSKNAIRGLHIHGKWEDDPKLVKKEVHNYFQNLFHETNGDRPVIPNGPRIELTVEEANLLEVSFNEQEIWEAVKGCDGSKAPGPDDFNFKFLKKYWNLIKRDLLVAIEWFWEKGEISNGCNASFMTLIPKCIDLTELGDYRSISLINSYYKVIAKLLANRIRRVLPRLIGIEQSAFLSERSILDGILVLNESVCDLKRSRARSFIFKADFAKAFDSVNWNFLLSMLSRMGFGAKWVKWIESCLKSASISILVNGSPTEEFKLQRGIRQGDPLSPFLFIIASERLNVLAQEARVKGLMSGVKVGKDKIPLTHFQYADDTIFIGEWSKRNIFNCIKLLLCFEDVSGLKINFEKSCLYGINVVTDEIELMAKQLKCSSGKLPFTYLGVPVGAKMNKSKDWDPVIKKFHKRFLDWKSRTVSFGGRLTLIKSVLNSLPASILHLLEGLRHIFFWDGSGEGNKMSWVKWNDILLPYGEGGLNIGSLKAKNWALLGKWWWRFRTETNAFWVKIIQSIYGREGGLGSSPNGRVGVGYSPWKDVIKIGMEMTKRGYNFNNSFVRNIDEGSDVLFWEDLWVGEQRLRDKYPRLYHLEEVKDAKINDRVLCNNGTRVFTWQWSRPPLGRNGVEVEQLQLEVRNQFHRLGSRTGWEWSSSEDGKFHTKTLTNILDLQLCEASGEARETEINRLLPQSIGIFIWRTKRRRLPDLESIDHAIVLCKYATEIWDRVFHWWGLGDFTLTSVNDVFNDHEGTIAGVKSTFLWRAVKWVCGYLIWKNRNLKVFRNETRSRDTLVNDIQIKSFEWISKRGKKLNIEWHQWLINPECEQQLEELQNSNYDRYSIGAINTRIQEAKSIKLAKVITKAQDKALDKLEAAEKAPEVSPLETERSMELSDKHLRRKYADVITRRSNPGKIVKCHRGTKRTFNISRDNHVHEKVDYRDLRVFGLNEWMEMLQYFIGK